MPPKILWLAACLALSAIACNDNTTNDTGDNNNQNNTSTPACKSNADCSSGQYCNSAAACQPHINPGTPIEKLTLKIVGRGSVTAVNGATEYGQCTSASCGYDIPKGTKGTLIANAANGWQFDSWAGDCSGTSGSVDLTMDADKSCTVTFIESPTPQVTVSISSVPADGPVSIDACGEDATCSVDEGTQVVMNAANRGGYRFDAWSGDEACVGDDGHPQQITLTATTDTTCTATYIQQYSIAVANGTCASLGISADAELCDGHQCSCSDGTCVVDVGAGADVTAGAQTGHHFDHWDGDGCPEASEGVVTAGSTTCTAQCAIDQEVIAIVINPSDAGYVGHMSCPAVGGSGSAECAVDPNDETKEIAPYGTSVTFSVDGVTDGADYTWSCNTGADVPILGLDSTITVEVNSTTTCTVNIIGPGPL